MSHIEKIKEFNLIVSSLLSQLIPLIGSTYNHYFNKLIKVNAVLPIENFYKYGYKYKEKIMEKDISYFSNSENHKDVLDDDNYRLNEILRLRGIYDKLDKNSVDNIWSILQALIILTEEYTHIKYGKLK